jgi:DNA-binding beta-propeller fold protein YncE
VKHAARMKNLLPLALIAGLLLPEMAFAKPSCPNGGTCGIDCDCSTDVPDTNPNTPQNSPPSTPTSTLSVTATSVTHTTQGNPWQALKTSSGNVLVTISGAKDGAEVFAPHGTDLKSSCVKAVPTGATVVANVRFAPKSADLAFGIGDAGAVFYPTDNVVSCNANSDGVTVAQGTGPGTLDVAVTPDGEYAFVMNEYGHVDGDPVASHSGSIGVVQLGRGSAGHVIASGTKLLGRIPMFGKSIAGMKLSPDGSRLYVTTEISDHGLQPAGQTNPILFHTSGCSQGPGTDTGTGLLTVIDVAKAKRNPDTSAIISTVAAGCSPVRMIVSCNGGTLWLTARGDNRVLAFSTELLETDAARALVGSAATGGDAPVGIALFHHDQLLAVTNSNRFNPANVGTTNATILDVSNPAVAKVLVKIKTGDFPREITVDPDDSTLYLTNFSSNSFQVIKTTVHEETK